MESLHKGLSALSGSISLSNTGQNRLGKFRPDDIDS